MPSTPPPPATLHGTETILLVEDEEQVRVLARTRAAERAHSYKLDDGRSVRAISPAYFLATKLVALGDRGEDALSSKDADDIITAVVEVPALEEELEVDRRGAGRALSPCACQAVLRDEDLDDFVDKLPAAHCASRDHKLFGDAPKTELDPLAE